MSLSKTSSLKEIDYCSEDLRKCSNERNSFSHFSSYAPFCSYTVKAAFETTGTENSSTIIS